MVSKYYNYAWATGGVLYGLVDTYMTHHSFQKMLNNPELVWSEQNPIARQAYMWGYRHLDSLGSSGGAVSLTILKALGIGLAFAICLYALRNGADYVYKWGAFVILALGLYVTYVNGVQLI